MRVGVAAIALRTAGASAGAKQASRPPCGTRLRRVPGARDWQEDFSMPYWRAPRRFVELAAIRSKDGMQRTLTMREQTRVPITDDWWPEPWQVACPRS